MPSAQDLQSDYDTLSVAVHPGTWAAMGQARPDRSGWAVQKAGLPGVAEMLTLEREYGTSINLWLTYDCDDCVGVF